MKKLTVVVGCILDLIVNWMIFEVEIVIYGSYRLFINPNVSQAIDNQQDNIFMLILFVSIALYYIIPLKNWGTTFMLKAIYPGFSLRKNKL